MMARAASCPDCECPPWRCPELAAAQSISVARRQPGPSSLASAREPARRPAAAGLGPDPRRARLRRASLRLRDHHQPLIALGAVVFGISTQTPAALQELATRLLLPFELLSDDGFQLTEALRLPTFTAGGPRLLRRQTLVVRHGVIETVFYPIFPPDRSTVQLIEWLANRQTG